LFRFISEKPVLTLFSICLLLFLSAGIFFNCRIPYPAIHYFILISFLTFLGQNYIQRAFIFISALLVLFVYALFPSYNFILLIGEIICLLLFVWLQKNNSDIFVFAIISSGFLFHLYYIQNTDINVRQHDLSGILYYIREITLNGINFFDFNPWKMYYLFHQPLHFIISGHILNFTMKLLGSGNVAQESLQYVSLFYVTMATIVAWGCLKELKLPIKMAISILILFVFNPTLFLFSGYISNDTLVFLWGILFIYYLICWFNAERLSYIVLAAVCFGLGTLTKLSILLLAPAVFILFMYKLFQTQNKENCLRALSWFAIIAIPLSLLWVLRNHILFDMSIFNIPDTSPAGQNFRFQTFFERISNFSSLFIPFINAPTVVESNMWLALIKTELFGEWNLSLLHQIVYFPASVLYFINILIKICAFIGCIYIICLFYKKRCSFLLLFFALVYLTIWIYSFKYAINYPYVCSSDYRLFSTMMLPEFIIFAVFLQNHKNVLSLFSIVYTCLSAFIYCLIF